MTDMNEWFADVEAMGGTDVPAEATNPQIWTYDAQGHALVKADAVDMEVLAWAISVGDMEQAKAAFDRIQALNGVSLY